jgi:hypothetical protein
MTPIPENALRARSLYSEGKPTREILAETGLNLWALYYWLDGGPVTAGVPALPPIEKRNRRAPKLKRAELIERMLRAAERQVTGIELQLEGTRQEPGEAERNVRTLAVLAKTMQSLAALDAQHKRAAPKPKAAKNESMPRSIDELRRSLARKLEAIIAERDAAPAAKRR